MNQTTNISSPGIADRPMTPFQWVIVAICFILNFNDGIDVLIVSYSSVGIMGDWALSKAEMGYIFSAGLAGMTAGAFLLAPYADTYGRRRIFLVALALETAGMFGAGLCEQYGWMLFFRFLTGFGIGGILPTMAATAAEFSNQKYRDFNVALVQAGWPVGAILSGMLFAKYVPVYGWQASFLAAGGISWLMFILTFVYMTDSLEFLQKSSSKNANEKLQKLANRLKLSPADIKLAIADSDEHVEKTGAKTLFSPEYRSSTFKIWVAAFAGYMVLYTLLSWVPTIASDAGLPFALATWVGIILNIGATLGSTSIGAIGGKYGLRQSILTYMLIAFLVMQVYAFSTLSTVMIFVLVFLIGVFVQGGFNGIWPTLARLYDVQLRTTGVGYAIGVGRFGAIFGPLLFGYLSDAEISIQTLFVIFSLPLLVMGISIFMIKSSRL